MDFENGGLLCKEWEDLLREMCWVVDVVGYLRFVLFKEYGGNDGFNFVMVVICEYLVVKGLGFYNDL